MNRHNVFRWLVTVLVALPVALAAIIVATVFGYHRVATLLTGGVIVGFPILLITLLLLTPRYGGGVSCRHIYH